LRESTFSEGRETHFLKSKFVNSFARRDAGWLHISNVT